MGAARTWCVSGACREHAQVGPMIDVKGQSTWSAS